MSLARRRSARLRAATGDRYDLIQVALARRVRCVVGRGCTRSAESYLYTVEAIALYLERLEPGGVLAITRWVDLPPRDMLKLFATAVTALERSGVADPGARLR